MMCDFVLNGLSFFSCTFVLTVMFNSACSISMSLRNIDLSANDLEKYAVGGPATAH